MVYDIQPLLKRERPLPCEMIVFMGLNLLVQEDISFIYREDGKSCCGRAPAIHPCRVLEFCCNDGITITGLHRSSNTNDFVFLLSFKGESITISRKALGYRFDEDVFVVKEGVIIGKTDKRFRPVGYTGQG